MPFITTEAYVVKEAGGPIELQTVRYDGVGEFELLIEAVAVSLCHTDIKAAKGGFLLKPPMVLGHESGGLVKSVGSGVTAFQPGDAVVLSFSSCSKCPRCLGGRAPYCDNILSLNFSGRRQDGSTPVTDDAGKTLNSHFFGQSSLSKLILAHQNGAVKVDVSRDELRKCAALGCGIQTGAGAILNVLNPPVQSSIAIWGAGAVGLAACLAARLTSPAHLILIDTSDEKLRMIPSDWATHTISASSMAEGEVAAKLNELTGRGVDYAIDAVGSGAVLKEAHAALAKCGTLLTLGGTAAPPQFAIDHHLLKGITYRGSHQGDSVPRIFIPKMIKLWRQGKFPFDKLLSEFAFTDFHKAVKETAAGRVIKPVLVLE